MALTPGWKRKPPKPHTHTLPRSEEDPTLMVTCKDIGGDDDGGSVTMAHRARVTGSRSTQVTTASLSCSTPDRSTLTLLHTWPAAFLPRWWSDENHLRLFFSWSTDSFHIGGSYHISCDLWFLGSENHFQISSAYVQLYISRVNCGRVQCVPRCETTSNTKDWLLHLLNLGADCALEEHNKLQMVDVSAAQTCRFANWSWTCKLFETGLGPVWNQATKMHPILQQGWISDAPISGVAAKDVEGKQHR